MKSLKFSLIILLVTNCSFFNKENTFKVINESDFAIDSLSITPDSKNQYLNLKKRNSKIVKTELGAIKTDGAFNITFRNQTDNSKQSRIFGYYTNGIANNYITIIRIKNDTILINSKFENAY